MQNTQSVCVHLQRQLQHPWPVWISDSLAIVNGLFCSCVRLLLWPNVKIFSHIGRQTERGSERERANGPVNMSTNKSSCKNGILNCFWHLYSGCQWKWNADKKILSLPVTQYLSGQSLDIGYRLAPPRRCIDASSIGIIKPLASHVDMKIVMCWQLLLARCAAETII